MSPHYTFSIMQLSSTKRHPRRDSSQHRELIKALFDYHTNSSTLSGGVIDSVLSHDSTMCYSLYEAATDHSTMNACSPAMKSVGSSLEYSGCFWYSQTLLSIDILAISLGSNSNNSRVAMLPCSIHRAAQSAQVRFARYNCTTLSDSSVARSLHIP